MAGKVDKTCDLRGAVGRAIVYDDDLVQMRGDRLMAERDEGLNQSIAPVVSRYDYAGQQPGLIAGVIPIFHVGGLST